MKYWSVQGFRLKAARGFHSSTCCLVLLISKSCFAQSDSEVLARLIPRATVEDTEKSRGKGSFALQLRTAADWFGLRDP